MSTTTRKARIGYPAAARLARILEERIQGGDYAPGTWLPAERALADEFQLDRTIVRAALDHLQHKSLITREPGRRPWVSEPPVLSLTQETDAVATVTIAAVLPHHPHYPAATSILKGMQQALRDTVDPFCRLLFFDTYLGEVATEELEKQALEALVSDNVAGIVLWPYIGSPESEPRTLPLIRRLQSQGKPVVFVDRYPDGELCDFVGVDDRKSARRAVEYLIGLGHRRIAHLTTTNPAVSVLERAAGYGEALRQAGIAPDPLLTFTVPVGQSLSSAAVLDRFFSMPDPPTAVFAMNDSLAHRLIQGLEERGARVPGSVSVIGCDDLERFSPRPMLLTTMHQPFDLIGKRAAELLLQRIRELRASEKTTKHTAVSDVDEGRGEPRDPSLSPLGAGQHLLLPTTLVERSTCRAIAPTPAV